MPFFLPSEHVGTAHLFAVQMALWQSEAPTHVLPSAQGEQGAPPPQSMSVSLLFLAPSEQVAAHTLLVQTPPLQSVLAPHALPVAQSGHAPPQSMSVSEPFLAPSAQPAPAHVLSLQTL